MLSTILNRELIDLRASFQCRGHDIRFVGGCVRDVLQNVEYKDVDFATDATPDEQREIYEQDGVTHIPTGLQHGTYTVVGRKSTYEITSLRTETNHDGRHATVAWTRDWIEDLSRRDLTINAMALTFDGDLIDPFGGKDDLLNGRVRFVGNPVTRMQEDYLRILRFFRFHARFSNNFYDPKAIAAAVDCAIGLEKISRERVWSEVSRIISGPGGPMILMDIADYGIGKYIGLDYTKGQLVPTVMAWHATREPASLMASWVHDPDKVLSLAQTWKWSADERDQASYITRQPVLDLKKAQQKVAVKGERLHWVAETLRVQGKNRDADALENWSVPVFPVGGIDLIAIGMKPGPNIGDVLWSLKKLWGKSDFTLDRETLLMEVIELPKAAEPG